MKSIFIVSASANHQEFSGQSTFVHKRCFEDRKVAEAYCPIFVDQILNDKEGLATYCNVKAFVQELEFVPK